MNTQHEQEQEHKSSRAPWYVASGIAVCVTVLALFATAMSEGVGMMILLVICVTALCGVGLLAFRGFTNTAALIADKRLDWLKEQNRSAEAVLKLGHMPNSYEPIMRPQIAAPVTEKEHKPLDPRHEKAIRLLTATIESDKYGSRSRKIMTQKDAGAIGIIADDWSEAVAYLFSYGVMTGSAGTMIKDDRTVARLMADVARGHEDAEASAVMSLPGIDR